MARRRRRWFAPSVLPPAVAADADAYRYAPDPDHIRPLARGSGPTLMTCQRCNIDKGNLALAVWLRGLETRRDPRAPSVAGVIDDLDEGKAQIVAGIVVLPIRHHTWKGIGGRAGP